MSEDNNGTVICPECGFEIEDLNQNIFRGDFFYNLCLKCRKYIKIEDTIQVNEEENERRRRREVIENHREHMRTRVNDFGELLYPPNNDPTPELGFEYFPTQPKQTEKYAKEIFVINEIETFNISVPNFQGRNKISLYLFELLKDKKIDTNKLVLRLKDIIINTDKLKSLTTKECNLIIQLDKDIKFFQDLTNNYSDIFNKYFFNLITIIKYLIISINSHKIIGARFAISPFVSFLLDNNINLFLTKESFYKAVRDIYNFLRERYFDFFPAQFRSKAKDLDKEKHRTIVGSRIKLYIMRNIYDGLYFDEASRIAICPICLIESNNGKKLTVSETFPRIRAKDFHHENIRLEGYNTKGLFKLFNKYRGNPEFLQTIINIMENEMVTLKCRCHHSIINSPYFNDFKKLINWENIPEEFPYKDIFDLEAEIIHILTKISVYSLYQGIKNKKSELDGAMKRIFFFLKKKYIIDRIHEGICPICREFNTRDHLPAFEFNHLYTMLYELGEITSEEMDGYKERKRRVPELFYLPCSELVKEMVIEEGGYVCGNCHRVVHTKIPYIEKIYNDPDLYKKALKDKKDSIKKNRQNIIHVKESIGNPLKLEKKNYIGFMENLIALFEISKSERDGVTRNILADYLGMRSQDVFEKRKFSRKYVTIVAGSGRTSPKKYYITLEGKRIVRLIYYFRDYYKEIK